MQDGDDTAPRVLVVDDDDDAREAMVLLLRLKGYNPVAAQNGKDALRYLRTEPLPRLIILDLWMPIMDGLQFRREQRSDPAIADIPVVVVTALSDRTDIDANAVLLKPLDVERFLSAVSRYCRQEHRREYES
jgi:CheY-like chemotaxis protein